MEDESEKNDKTWSYFHYNQFSIGSASEEYPLTVEGFTGEDSDWFAHYDGIKFSTTDNDNDQNRGNCAAGSKSGWWYSNCFCINPNVKPSNKHSSAGKSLFAEMKIRLKDCIIHTHSSL